MTDIIWWFGAAVLTIGGFGVFCFVASWALEKLLQATRQGRWLVAAAWQTRAEHIMRKGKRQ